jgi:hypothetical protein
MIVPYVTPNQGRVQENAGRTIASIRAERSAISFGKIELTILVPVGIFVSLIAEDPDEPKNHSGICVEKGISLLCEGRGAICLVKKKEGDLSEP